MKNITKIIIGVYLLSFWLMGCSERKNDSVYNISIINLSPYQIKVDWESSQGNGTIVLDTLRSIGSYKLIYTEENEDVGNLEFWNDAKFSANIKKITIQRISMQGDTLDPVPKDFSDFKYWKQEYSKNHSIGDVEHIYAFTLQCTDSLLSQ